MRRVATLVIILTILAIITVPVSATEVQYTIKTNPKNYFNAYTMLHTEKETLIGGLYTYIVENKTKTDIAILRIAEGKNSKGFVYLLQYNNSPVRPAIFDNPPFIVNSSDGYYLVASGDTEAIQSFDGILIMKLNKELKPEWGEIISAFYNRTYADGSVKWYRMHISHRDVTVKNGYLYILAKFLKNLVVIKVSPDGEVLWATGVKVTFGLEPAGIDVEGDTVYAVGSNPKSAIGGSRIILVRMNDNGTVLNVLSYSHVEDAPLLMASGVKASHGRVYIVGIYDVMVNGWRTDYPLVISTTQNGSPVWSIFLNGPGLLDNAFTVAGNSLYMESYGSWLYGGKELGLENHIVVSKITSDGKLEWSVAYKPRGFVIPRTIREPFARDNNIYGAIGFFGATHRVILFANPKGDPCWKKLDFQTEYLPLKVHPVGKRYLSVSKVRTEVLKGVLGEIREIEVDYKKLCLGGTTTTISPTPTSSTRETPSTTSTTSTETSHWTSYRGNRETSTTPSSKSGPKSSGICGPAMFVGLVLLPASIRRH